MCVARILPGDYAASNLSPNRLDAMKNLRKENREKIDTNVYIRIVRLMCSVCFSF